jgi:peptide subunit release factor 1 (eRF1)
MGLQDRIAQLAKLHVPSGVVSVYLNTRWSDQHQRDRTRVFVRDEVRRARRAGVASGVEAALGWIEAETDALVAQARDPSIQGTALFASPHAAVREVVGTRGPFEPAFVVGDAPYLRPLAAMLAESPPALVVFVDGEHARLIPLTTEGVDEEVVLESAVPGQHRRGGWAQLAQSRYARHIEQQRTEHYDAVVAAVTAAADQRQVRWVVLAGDSGTLGAVRDRVPAAFQPRIAGTVRAARHEPAAAIAARGDEVLRRVEAEAARRAVAQALTEAAKGQRAVTGVDDTVAAASRGAVRQLLLLQSFAETGRACTGCGALARGDAATCPLCHSPTRPVELGDAATGRVLAAGGEVAVLANDLALAQAGGMAALLRFPL